MGRKDVAGYSYCLPQYVDGRWAVGHEPAEPFCPFSSISFVDFFPAAQRNAFSAYHVAQVSPQLTTFPCSSLIAVQAGVDRREMAVVTSFRK